MKMSVVMLAVATAASAVCSGETMRCGKWVVDTEATPEELVAKCGEPTRRETETKEVWRPSEAGPGNVMVGTTTVERWIYERGPQSFVMAVTIVDGRLKSIDRAE